jgi:hypothetical protein
MWVAGSFEEPGTDAPSDAVAHDSGADLAWHGERDPWWVRRGVAQVGHRDRVDSGAPTGPPQLEERSTVTDPPDQAERR